MDSYKGILIYIVAALFAILYLRQCNKGSLAVDPEVVIKVDSTYIKDSKPDTVYLDSISYSIKWLKPEKEYITEYDTIYMDSVNVFKTPYKDSLIEGSITTRSTGKVLSTDLIYVPKFPKYITSVDTFRIDSTTTVTKSKWGLYAGAIIGGNETKFSIQPSILLKTNKGLQFSAGYGLIDKTYNFGIFTVIKNPFKK
jgi:hypothetical protein